MKISELIDKLNDFRTEHGDLDCVGYDEEQGYYSIHDVSQVKNVMDKPETNWAELR
jgi:hypothetical protein